MNAEIRPASHIVRWFLKTFGYGGITIYPFGIYILAERLNEQPLIRHEQCHWQQVLKMGAIRWYVVYLFNNLRYGYWNNPLEIEARAAENQGKQI